MSCYVCCCYWSKLFALLFTNMSSVKLVRTRLHEQVYTDIQTAYHLNALVKCFHCQTSFTVIGEYKSKGNGLKRLFHVDF